MGCNMGACHGSANGKGNFKLSLRGENPEADFATLTKNRESKRLNVADPDASYLLRKPSKRVDHEGGRRFAPDSEEYRLLRAWIAAGAPADPDDTPSLTGLSVSPPEAIVEEPERTVQLAVTATFSDGGTRDVTRMVVYEPANLLVEAGRGGMIAAKSSGESTVMVRFEHLQVPVTLAFLPQRPGFQWSAPPEYNFIDSHVFAKLKRMRLLPSDLCDDVTFLRRAFFDLIGQPPTREEAEAFLASTNPDKREKLVDALLDRPEYAEWWAIKWADLLRVEERVLDATGTTAMYRWLRDSLASDKPMDEFAREIITAQGSTWQNPPANYYRALREATLRSETTAQIFLGTRLACAKCHNHPFERWTQDDYYRFAAVFDGMDYTILDNRRTDENDKMEFVGEQVVHLGGKRELKDPRSKKEPVPGLIGSDTHAVGTGPERFAELANWMTAKDHPLFAKVQVNRAWAHLMGRGLVDPVDDFRLTNPPSIPALLEALAQRFTGDGFRLKPLLRLICASRTYQLSAVPNDTNADDSVNFSHGYVRRFPAEPLLDAIHAALGVTPDLGRFPGARRASQITGARFIIKSRRPSPVELFLREFGKPPRNTACDCERSNATSLAQIFTLTSSPEIDRLLRKDDNRFGALLREGKPATEILTDLYWRALSRPPSAPESAKLVPAIEQSPDRRAALEDIAWSLLNSKEFLLRR
jgi:Protein of unknown function (DUF1549)/Protein of unknown function (DUF1553)